MKGVRRWAPGALLVGALCGGGEFAAPGMSQEPTDFEEYGPYLDSLMAAAEVPGISFAFFDHTGVLWEYVSGVKRAGSAAPIGSETVFEAASITKPVFAFIVQSLALQGVLDIDAPLSDLVDPIPEVGYDPRSALLTPRMLLSHQGGLPNWRSRLNLEAASLDELFGPTDTLRFVFEPGERYRYSGEGYVLLQRAVQAYTGQSLGDLATVYVFGPLGMRRTSVSFDDLAERDFALGHSAGGRPEKWGLRAALSSSTLHTTASDLGRFGARLASEISTSGPFSPLADPVVTVREEDGIRLGWALGLSVIDTPTGRYVRHGGNNVIFIADFIYGVEEDLGYVLLTNSAKGPEIVDALERRVFGGRLQR